MHLERTQIYMQPILSEEAMVRSKRQCLWFVMDRFKNLEQFKVGNVMLEPPQLIVVNNSSELHIKAKHCFSDLSNYAFYSPATLSVYSNPDSTLIFSPHPIIKYFILLFTDLVFCSFFKKTFSFSLL